MPSYVNTNAVPVYDPAAYQWPGFGRGQVPLAPVRVGVDRRTGKMIMGWPHVYQSMSVIFRTRFHQRVLRRWVGSFVPHLLGQNASPRYITRFFWAIAGSLDLWEPGYRFEKADISDTTAVGLQSRGELVSRLTGQYRPRGHLGDNTPAERRGANIIGSGANWNATQD